jgi:hypothetical protein
MWREAPFPHADEHVTWNEVPVPEGSLQHANLLWLIHTCGRITMLFVQLLW